MKPVSLVRRNDYSFMPAWDEDKKKLDRIKPDDIICVYFKKPRNPKNHRRFFKMLDIVIENFPENIPDRYHDVDYFRYEIMVGIGHCEWRESYGGTRYPVAKSISFESIDEDKFQELYHRSVDYILKHFMKGTDKSDLLAMVEEHVNLFV